MANYIQEVPKTFPSYRCKIMIQSNKIFDSEQSESLCNKQTALIQSNTTQVYFDSNFAFTYELRVSTYTQAILKHVNTNVL